MAETPIRLVVEVEAPVGARSYPLGTGAIDVHLPVSLHSLVENHLRVCLVRRGAYPKGGHRPGGVSLAYAHWRLLQRVWVHDDPSTQQTHPCLSPPPLGMLMPTPPSSIRRCALAKLHFRTLVRRTKASTNT